MELETAAVMLRLALSLILALSLFSIGCSKGSHSAGDPQPAPRGGQDGGGGSGGASTPAEVKAAIAKAFRLATSADKKRNIFFAFGEYWRDRVQGKGDQIQFHPKRFFPDLSLEGFFFPETVYPFNHKSPVIEALALKSIHLNEQGPCEARNNRHADASVTAYSTSAEICLSVANLTRFPKASLLPETLALLLHETAHMAGAEEEEAQFWQNRFLDYYQAVMNQAQSGQVIQAGKQSMDEVRENIGLAKELLEKRKIEAKYNGRSVEFQVFIEIGRMTKSAEKMGFLDRPILLELAQDLSDVARLNLYLDAGHDFQEFVARNFVGEVTYVSDLRCELNPEWKGCYKEPHRRPVPNLSLDKLYRVLDECGRRLDVVLQKFAEAFPDAAASGAAASIRAPQAASASEPIN